MSTIAPVEETLDLTFLDELGEDKVECFWHNCDDGAEWRARWTCGHSSTYCTRHRVTLEPNKVRCAHHNEIVSPGIWGPL